MTIELINFFFFIEFFFARVSKSKAQLVNFKCKKFVKMIPGSLSSFCEKFARVLSSLYGPICRRGPETMKPTISSPV